MFGARRIAVVASMVGMVLATPVGVVEAQAGDRDAGPGGVLSNLSGRNSSGHANLCGTGKVALFKDRTCLSEDTGESGGGDQAGPSGGLLSNLLFARNASGHSNNCGNETVSVMSRTTCVTVDRSSH
ncbi:hypothetical protein ACFWMV_33105 [Streptomyces mutabilis]|uniref:hypothetical protein n=1 Tax=Streptomyces mutabilis TaxID=67332 RepID=UPI00366317B7